MRRMIGSPGDRRIEGGWSSMACAAQVILLCFGQLRAQGVEQPLTFDAASVKRASPNLPDGRTVVGMLPPTGGPRHVRPRSNSLPDHQPRSAHPERLPSEAGGEDRWSILARGGLLSG